MTQIHQISEDTLSQAYALMSEERRLRCDRLRTDSEKRACICGDMLIRKFAKEHLASQEACSTATACAPHAISLQTTT